MVTENETETDLNPALGTFEGIRTSPFNSHAEQSLLGALMLDNSAWDRIADQITEKDLQRREHRLIFNAIAKLADSAQPFDIVTLSETLERMQRLAETGGVAYLSKIVNETPTASNIQTYANIVRQNSILRQIVAAGSEIAESAFHPQGKDAKILLDEAERRVFSISEQMMRGTGGFQPIRQLVAQSVERIEILRQRDDVITGVATGFTDFDHMTAGLQPADLIIVAGRPSMGKCVAAGTEIIVADGRILTIDTIVRNRQAQILTVGAEWRLQPAYPTVYLDDGLKPVFRLTTKSGRRVDTTASHPFLTPTGWRALIELTPEEKIAVPCRLPVFGNQALRDCEVKLLSYLIGVRAQIAHVLHTPMILNANAQIQHDFRKSFLAFQNIHAPHHNHTENLQINNFCFNTIWAQRRGLDNQWIATVHQACQRFAWPARVLHCAANCVPNNVDPTAKKSLKNHALPVMATHCCPVAQEIWRAVSWEHASRGWPQILIRWLTRVGLGECDTQSSAIPAAIFRLPKIQIALFLNRLFGCGGWVADNLIKPIYLGYKSVSERLIRQIQHLLLRFGILATVKHAEHVGSNNQRKNWQLEVNDLESLRIFATEIGIFAQEAALSRLLHAAGKLPELTRQDLIWDPIISIKPLGLRRVYDLTIPETHNFIANDICVHNTSFALNLTEHVALKNRLPVAIFSLEMSSIMLVFRMLSSVGRIDHHRIRTGKLEKHEWPLLAAFSNQVADTKIFIDDTPALSPIDIRTRARRLKREQQDLALIVLDYLQLMQAPGHHDNRVSEISAISRSLKALAKELNVPVLALSQLNRGLEQRPNKRPIMSDLRDCVTGDTLVYLTNGQQRAIGELVGQSVEIFSVNQMGNLIHAQTDRIWVVGHRPVFRIELANGQTIRATAQHRLFAAQHGWTKVGALTVGSQLAIIKNYENHKNYQDYQDFNWEQIIAIEPAGAEKVYDLTVPGPANWCANGIVSHNSGAIEQDADLIVFIYRDEVYHKDSPDKGTAEIIISKQRNGPIGTTRLTFIGKYTKFENHTNVYNRPVS